MKLNEIIRYIIFNYAIISSKQLNWFFAKIILNTL